MYTTFLPEYMRVGRGAIIAGYCQNIVKFMLIKSVNFLRMNHQHFETTFILSNLEVQFLFTELMTELVFNSVTLSFFKGHNLIKVTP